MSEQQEHDEGWTEKDQQQEPKLHNQPTTREAEMAKGEWQTLDPAERRRRYDFPNGKSVEFENVTRVKVSESGTHYLEYEKRAGYDKAIVETSGRVIYLDMDAWTF